MVANQFLLIWTNASFQKQGNASLEISSEVWVSKSIGEDARWSSNFEKRARERYLQLTSSHLGENFPTSYVWPATFQFKTSDQQ